MREKAKILTAEEIERALKRIAHEILENNKDMDELALVGIRTRGAHLAERLKNYIKEIANKELPLGILDITLYRDDLTAIEQLEHVQRGNETRSPIWTLS